MAGAPREGGGRALRPTRIESPVQLLVEGKDPLNWFRWAVNNLRLTGIQIQNYGGVNDFRRFMSAFINTPGFAMVTRIGIVRDAEDSAARARASASGALRDVGLPVPGEEDSTPGQAPRVSLLILPDGRGPGMLESALAETVRDTPVGHCVAEFLECAENAARARIRRRPKAFVHAFLATRPDPHVSVGVAALKGYWNLQHPALNGVRTFLLDLASA